MKCIGLAAGALLLITASSASGHSFSPGLVSIRDVDKGRYEVFWRPSPSASAKQSVTPRWPVGCLVKSRGAAESEIAAWSTVDCSDAQASSGDGLKVLLEGSPDARVEVIVHHVNLDGESTTAVLQKGERTFTLPGHQVKTTSLSTWPTAKSYFLLGVDHILFGIDHLVFVLLVLLAASRLGLLVKAITAFTIGHSVTLAATILKWIQVPQALTEALIALSIMIVAAALVRSRGDASRSIEARPWPSTLVFGLVHGLGFAGALRETGVPPESVPLALAAFNIGVESGQLLFVGALAVGWRFLRTFSAVSTRWRIPIAYVAGVAGAAWLIERVSLFWPAE